MFSDKICQLCYNDLEVFGQFRKDLIIKQNALYRAAQKHPEIASHLFKVKSEINEFIDCNPTEALDDEEEDSFNPQCVIKSEADDMVHVDYLLETDDYTWKLPKTGSEKIRDM